VLALEANEYPELEIRDFYKPFSRDPQERALVCLLLDNDTWCSLQREILWLPAWKAVWTKLRRVGAWNAWRCRLTACSTVPQD
jgi:hypothetical protein